MGMGFCANHGWVIKITPDNWSQFCLPGDPYEGGIEDYQLATVKLKNGETVEGSCYHYDSNNGDRYDDLTDGWYVMFSVIDLFNPKPFLEEMVNDHGLTQAWWVELG